MAPYTRLMALPAIQTPPFDRPWLVFNPQCDSCRGMLRVWDHWGLLSDVYVVSYPEIHRALPESVREAAAEHMLLFEPRTAQTWQDDPLFDQLLTLHRRSSWERAWLQLQRRTLTLPAEGPSADTLTGRLSMIPFLWVGLTVWAIVTMLWGASLASALGDDPLRGSRLALMISGTGWTLAAFSLIAVHQWGFHGSQDEGVTLLRQMVMLMLVSLIPIVAAATFSMALAEQATPLLLWLLNGLGLAVALALVGRLLLTWTQILDYPRVYLWVAISALVLGSVAIAWLIVPRY